MRILAAITVLAGLAAAPTQAEANRTVIDMAGRTVTIPANPQRISCFEVLCYEKFFLLRGTDRLVEAMRTDPPWLPVIAPSFAGMQQVEGTPNREELLAQNIDLILLRSAHLSAVGKIGVPAVVTQPPLELQYPDAAAFIETQKKMVRLMGEIIGGDGDRRAGDWCAYYDAHIAAIADRVRDVPPERRPRVYYVRGPAAVNTQGPNSDTYWYGTIAGARMIVDGLKLNGQGPMSLEEILRLDPDYVFVGRQYSPDLILNDPAWRNVSAVRNHRVIALPSGLFYWDGGIEGVLLADFIAKTLYLDRFADLDLGQAVQDFYGRFYGFAFTPDQLAKFLAGLTPDGVRRGY